jgi:hypothetical protein
VCHSATVGARAYALPWRVNPRLLRSWMRSRSAIAARSDWAAFCKQLSLHMEASPVRLHTPDWHMHAHIHTLHALTHAVMQIQARAFRNARTLTRLPTRTPTHKCKRSRTNTASFAHSVISASVMRRPKLGMRLDPCGLECGRLLEMYRRLRSSCEPLVHAH